jgi:hypothetical protein
MDDAVVYCHQNIYFNFKKYLKSRQISDTMHYTCDVMFINIALPTLDLSSSNRAQDWTIFLT